MDKHWMIVRVECQECGGKIELYGLHNKPDYNNWNFPKRICPKVHLFHNPDGVKWTEVKGTTSW